MSGIGLQGTLQYVELWGGGVRRGARVKHGVHVSSLDSREAYNINITEAMANFAPLGIQYKFMVKRSNNIYTLRYGDITMCP